MIRLLLALLVFVAAGDARAEAVSLRQAVTVEGEVIRLGDLFDGLSDNAGIAVAHAPQPGRRLVLDARWLAGVAAAYKVEWRPLGQYDRVLVERATAVLGREHIEAPLAAELAAAGAPADARIELTARDLRLQVPAAAADSVAVHDLAYDARARRFSAVVEAPAGSPNATRLRISGRVYTTVEVPVLNRHLNRGEAIGSGDIEWIEIRDEHVRRDVVTDADALIGFVARQSIRPGVALRHAQVQRPVAVAKGSLVTIVLQVGSMTLTAQGKANENGSLGDVIRVTNTQSNTAVEGKVVAENLVTVSPLHRILAN